MQTKVIVLIVIVTVIAAGASAQQQRSWKPVLQSEYGNDLKQCKNEWSQISASKPKQVASCYHKLSMAVSQRLKDPAGIKEIGVKQFDPFTIQHLSIANSEVLKGELTDVKLYGITQYLNSRDSRMEYTPEDKTLTYTVLAKRGKLTGNYKLQLNLAALFGDKSGQGTVTSGKVIGYASDLGFTVKSQLRPMNNNQGLQVAKVESSFTIGNATFDFEGNSPSDEGLTKLMNTMMLERENAMILINEARTTIVNAVSEAIGTVLYKGWKNLDKL
jgi:hypothetical protein